MRPSISRTGRTSLDIPLVPKAAQVTERVVIDRLLRALPRVFHQAVGMRNPTTTSELVEAIELAEAAHRREAGERVPALGQRAPEGISRPIDRTAAPEPQDKSMHQELPKGAPTAEIKINGRLFTAVLDSGSAVSLVQTKILPPPYETKTVLPITCVHGDMREVPVRRVTISTVLGSWPVEVGLMKDLVKDQTEDSLFNPKRPLAVPDPSLRPSWGTRHVPEAHGHRPSPTSAVRSSVPRRCRGPFGALGGPPRPSAEGAYGASKGWTRRQPSQVSPSAL